MFRDYLYVSSTSQTFRDHCADLAEDAVRVSGAKAGDSVLDIASNDGYLLEQFKSHGLSVVGVDPARNLAREATARGIWTICDYWPVVLRDKQTIITATNVLGHVDDVHRFVQGVKAALAPGGVLIVEVPYVQDLIEQVAFDTIYHEHLSYWSLGPIKRLFEDNGLTLFDVKHQDIHGGTIRVYGSHQGERATSDRMMEMLGVEQDSLTRDKYLHFGLRAQGIKNDITSLVREIRARGKSVWAYGASAKGNTLLNYCELTNDDIPVAVDDNPKKHGLYTPGSHLRIVPAEALGKGAGPDYLLLLAWNFEREITERARAAGFTGGFIHPLRSAALS